MALYVKDPEVDRLTKRLAMLSRSSKTEVVRRALRRELEHVEGPDPALSRIEALTRDLHARAGPDRGLVDKAFIDGLYE